MFSRWARLPGKTLQFMRSPDTGGFLAIALLIGVAVGLGAAALVYALDGVEYLRDLFIEDGLDGARWGLLVTVPLGILLAWVIARKWAPEVAGDGVPEVSAALVVRGGYLSTRSIPLKIIATALTLGGGGSAGREGPIVHIGGAIGSSIARHTGLGEDKVRSLLAAGAAAGIGASFNAPIAGMLFALEVILGSFAVKHMSAVVLASVSAAVTLRSIVPKDEILGAALYSLNDPRELILYAGLSVVAVAAAYLFLRLLDLSEGFARDRLPKPWLRPITLGLAVAGLAMWEPRLLGTGQRFLGELLTIQDIGEQFSVDLFAVRVLFLLALAKIVATSLTIAAGGSGGAFLPSLFIGATLGTGYAQMVSKVWTVSDIRPGAFAVVGMATVFAAVARAPLTAILIVFEVTGANDYGLVLPLMLSATVASFVADRVHPESVYTMALARRGIKLVRAGEVDILDTVRVGDVMFAMGIELAPTTPIGDAARVMNERRFHGIPVVEKGRLVGIITITDLIKTGPTGIVADAMTSRPVTVTPSTRVSDALARMASLGVGRLPVVDDADPSRLVGMFRREEAVKAYHLALGTSTDHSLARERLRQRTASEAHYFEFRVPPGSIADGRSVREVAWPEGATIVSVRRGTSVIVPQGSTVLHRDDVITAFGTDSSRATMIERMNAGADQATAEILLSELDDAATDPGPT
jgi:CIC family chloride channel protein